jgi:Transposase DDE domain group 1
LQPWDVWCAIVALALDITAWMQTLALTSHDARRWEPKRLRLRLFTIPAAIARTARRTTLHLSDRAPWAAVAVDAIHRLDQLRAPG